LSSNFDRHSLCNFFQWYNTLIEIMEEVNSGTSLYKLYLHSLKLFVVPVSCKYQHCNSLCLSVNNMLVHSFMDTYSHPITGLTRWIPGPNAI